MLVQYIIVHYQYVSYFLNLFLDKYSAKFSHHNTEFWNCSAMRYFHNSEKQNILPSPPYSLVGRDTNQDRRSSLWSLCSVPSQLVYSNLSLPMKIHVHVQRESSLLAMLLLGLWFRGSPTTGRQHGSTVVIPGPDMPDFSDEGLLYTFTSNQLLKLKTAPNWAVPTRASGMVLYCIRTVRCSTNNAYRTTHSPPAKLGITPV